MKKSPIVSIMITCILGIGLFSTSLRAEDFSIMGIKWTDDLDTVRDKIKQSGLARDNQPMFLQRESTPLSSIIKNPMIDEERSRELTHTAEKLKKDFQFERQLKFIEFRGKRDSILKNGIFFFTYDRDVLLAYDIFLNPSTGKATNETGEGEFYQDLIKKYGAPTKTLKYSKVWSKNEQTLYYTVINETVVVTYVSESSLSAYVDRIEGKPKVLDQTNQPLGTGDVRVY